MRKKARASSCLSQKTSKKRSQISDDVMIKTIVKRIMQIIYKNLLYFIKIINKEIFLMALRDITKILQ